MKLSARQAPFYEMRSHALSFFKTVGPQQLLRDKNSRNHESHDVNIATIIFAEVNQPLSILTIEYPFAKSFPHFILKV